jgi:hypothetical protein
LTIGVEVAGIGEGVLGKGYADEALPVVSRIEDKELKSWKPINKSPTTTNRLNTSRKKFVKCFMLALLYLNKPCRTKESSVR